MLHINGIKTHLCGSGGLWRPGCRPTLLGAIQRLEQGLEQCANHISDATLAAWAHHPPLSLCFPPFFRYIHPSSSFAFSLSRTINFPLWFIVPLTHYPIPLFSSLSLWGDLSMTHSWRIPGASERCYPSGEMTRGIDPPTSRSIAKRLFPTHTGTDRTIRGDV